MKTKDRFGTVTYSKINANGSEVLYRQDGPAYADIHGHKEWYNKNGDLHRIDGPAVTTPMGDSLWYLNGLLHRENGPAIVWASGYVQYWKHGKRYFPAPQAHTLDDDWLV